jgi:hypothetical protein
MTRVNPMDFAGFNLEPNTPDWIAQMERLAHHFARQGSVFGVEQDVQAAKCIRALCELVQLKAWKDKYGADLVYQRDRQRAWIQAFKACNHPDLPA